MKISCPNCSVAYDMDESRIPPGGLTIKCPKCMTPFAVKRPATAADAPVPLPGSAPVKPMSASMPGLKAAPPPPGAPPRSTVPLPAGRPPGAVPLPGSAPPAGRPPGASGGAGSVPLPGASAPPSGRPPGAVPLPAGPAPSAKIDFEAFLPPPAPPAAKPPPRPAPPPQRAAPAALDLDFGSVELSDAPPPPSAPAKASNSMGAVSLADDLDSPSNAMQLDDGLPDGHAAPASGAKADSNLELLDFVDEAKPTAASDSAGQRFSVRRKSGKVFGPFDAPAIIGMLTQGQLLGNEDVSPDGATWTPIAEHPAFVGSVPEVRQPETGRSAPPPPVLSVTGDDEPAKPVEKRPRGEKLKLLAMRLRRQPRLAAQAGGLLALVVFVAAGVYSGVRTPRGYFWINVFHRGIRPSPPELSKVRELLDEDTFASTHKAFDLALATLEKADDDEQTQWVFCRAAFSLKRQYGATDGYERALKLTEKLDPRHLAGAKAKAYRQLMSGDDMKGRTSLDNLAKTYPADVEVAVLQGWALLASGDLVNAGKAADRGLAVPGGDSARLLALRAQIFAAGGDTAKARAFAQKALAKNPMHGRALLLLSSLELDAQNVDLAKGYLDTLLGPARTELDGAEEAKARTLKGRLLALMHDPAGAETEFETALKLDPASARAHFEYARFRLARHEFEKAIAQMEPAVKAEPANGAYTDVYVRALLDGGRAGDAAKLLEDALKRSPQDPTLLFLQGRVAEGAGKYDDVVQKYTAALAKRPDYMEAKVALGLWYLRSTKEGDDKKAREQFEAAGQKAPTDPMVQAGLGAMYLLSKAPADKEKARGAFQLATDKDPDNPDAHAGLGKALSALGDLQGAKKELETALRIVDKDPSVHYEYGSVLEKLGDLDGAAAALKRAVDLPPANDQFIARYGRVLYEKGDLQGAYDELSKAMNLNDSQPETLFYYGLVMSQRDQQAPALESLKKVVDLAPDYPLVHQELGLIYEKGQQARDAQSEFNLQIAKGDTADTEEHLGNALVMLNQHPQAITAYQKAYKLEPKRSRLLSLIGDAQAASGRMDEAIKSYRAALEQEPSLKGVHAKLGDAFTKGDHGKEALAEFEKARNDDKDDYHSLFQMGLIYRDAKQVKRAKEAFEGVVKGKDKATPDEVQQAGDILDDMKNE